MIKARTIMTENVLTIKENATLAEAAESLIRNNVSDLVVTKNDKPIAIVTENGLIRGAINKNSTRTKVKDIMDKNFHAISPETDYHHLVKRLRGEKIKIFPVVENDNLVGIVTETDIVDATRDFTRFHQIMQEVILMVFGLVTAFFLFFFSPLGQSIRSSLALFQ